MRRPHATEHIVRVLCLVLLVLVAAAVSPPAQATVGSADQVWVVGYEPTDGKVFLVRDPEGVVGPPQVFYYGVDDPPAEQRPDTPVRVRSWPDDTVQERLRALRERLVPLEASSRRGLSMTVTHGKLVSCPQQSRTPDNAASREALRLATDVGMVMVDVEGRSISEAVCREVDVVVRHAGLEARTSLITWGDTEIASVHRIPDSHRYLVILEHTGVTIESGYPQHIPLLLDTPPPDSEPHG